MNNLRYNNKTPSKYYYGAAEVPSIYYGSTQVYSAQPYKELQYIQSSGTQYIDLGFKLTNNHAVDLDLQMVNLNANIFGSREGGQNRAFTLFSSTSVMMTDMGTTRNSTSPTTDRINVYLSSSKIKIGTFEKNISSGSFTTPGNGYIFNISYNRPQSYMASMKLYGCKIYLSGTLIRDLIPCKYNNQIGLWDVINGSFLGNAGTGEFIAGPEQGNVTIKYTELEYIQSSGSQYIDTKYIPSTSKTKIITNEGCIIHRHRNYNSFNGYNDYRCDIRKCFRICDKIISDNPWMKLSRAHLFKEMIQDNKDEFDILKISTRELSTDIIDQMINYWVLDDKTSVIFDGVKVEDHYDVFKEYCKKKRECSGECSSCMACKKYYEIFTS